MQRAPACSAEAGGLQDGHLGLLFIVWHGSTLPGLLTVSCHLQKVVVSCILMLEDLCRQANLRQFWGSIFPGCWPKVVEQHASWS